MKPIGRPQTVIATWPINASALRAAIPAPAKSISLRRYFGHARHCERSSRSNPHTGQEKDCFVTPFLAMTLRTLSAFSAV
jgi:hypothetical protein